jgi:hypothetical protein
MMMMTPIKTFKGTEYTVVLTYNYQFYLFVKCCVDSGIKSQKSMNNRIQALKTKGVAHIHNVVVWWTVFNYCHCSNYSGSG